MDRMALWEAVDTLRSPAELLRNAARAVEVAEDDIGVLALLRDRAEALLDALWVIEGASQAEDLKEAWPHPQRTPAGQACIWHDCFSLPVIILGIERAMNGPTRKIRKTPAWSWCEQACGDLAERVLAWVEAHANATAEEVAHV